MRRNATLLYRITGGEGEEEELQYDETVEVADKGDHLVL